MYAWITAAVCLLLMIYILSGATSYRAGQWVDLRGLIFYKVIKVNPRMCYVTIFQNRRYITFHLDEFNSDFSDCRIVNFTTHVSLQDADAHLDRMCELYLPTLTKA